MPLSGSTPLRDQPVFVPALSESDPDDWNVSGGRPSSTVPNGGPRLQILSLVKHYESVGGEPTRAVDGVSMSVAPGEIAALYGPSGSGKTTLLLMVAGLLEPTAGTIIVGTRSVAAMSEKESASFRLSELGFVRQNFDLLPGVSVLDNAALKLLKSVRYHKAREQITPLLEQLGLGDRLEFNTEQLSMGERQRVMIARALSTGPSLLLADEPTGALDTARSREVLELLREICVERNVAILMVSHDPDAAGYADRVYELRDGKLGPYRGARPAALDGLS